MVIDGSVITHIIQHSDEQEHPNATDSIIRWPETLPTQHQDSPTMTDDSHAIKITVSSHWTKMEPLEGTAAVVAKLTYFTCRCTDSHTHTTEIIPTSNTTQGWAIMPKTSHMLQVTESGEGEVLHVHWIDDGWYQWLLSHPWDRGIYKK